MTVVASSTPESVLGLLQTLCHSADDGSGRVGECKGDRWRIRAGA